MSIPSTNLQMSFTSRDNIEKELQDMIRRVDQRTAFLRKWIDNITEPYETLVRMTQTRDLNCNNLI